MIKKTAIIWKVWTTLSLTDDTAYHNVLYFSPLNVKLSQIHLLMAVIACIRNWHRIKNVSDLLGKCTHLWGPTFSMITHKSTFLNIYFLILWCIDFLH